MSRDQVRDTILENAGRLFADRGFKQTTVRDICQSAGVNVAAVNYYFRNKRNLYLEAVTYAYQRRSSEVPMPDWPPGTPPNQKLRGFVATMMRRMMGLDEAPWTTRLMTREVLNPTQACQALVTEYFRPQMQRLEQILWELLPAAIPTHRLHQLVFSVVGQCLFYRTAGGVVAMMISPEERADHYSVTELADHIADCTLAALSQLPSHWYASPGGVSPASADDVHVIAHPTAWERL